jgi:prepilin-type N-terminal cleavage/methylation domain-containing protein
MILPSLGLINKNQRGFTLMEVLIALALAGIIATAATMTTFQVINGSSRTSNQMTAVKQVQNAGCWVSWDVQMAQTVEPAASPDPDGFPLYLKWTEWGGTVHEVTYNIDIVNKQLKRSSSVNGGEPTVTTVAEFIAADTNCEFGGGVLTFTVTATVGAGSQEATETRIYEIKQRPNAPS